MMSITKIEDLENYKSRDLIPLKCENCGLIFYRSKNRILDNYSRIKKITSACSPKCAGQLLTKQNSKELFCKQCGKKIIKSNCYISKNNFCSHSCSAIYGNSHKTTGTCRSKLEMWLEKKLIDLYPTLKIDFNKINAINKELDIYIPNLKLAFELNGIFHYKPIFGEQKLKLTQINDDKKRQYCLEKNIELHVIDSSNQKFFKEQTSQTFLTIITEIINMKMAVSTSVDLESN